MWHAATPVDAVANVVAAGRRFMISRSRKDLPVPAPPVKKSDVPLSAARSTSACSSVSASAAPGESDGPPASDQSGEAMSRSRDFFFSTRGVRLGRPDGRLALDGDMRASARFGGGVGAGTLAFGGGGRPDASDPHHARSSAASASLTRMRRLRFTMISVHLP